jgi:hypothetical protein
MKTPAICVVLGSVLLLAACAAHTGSMYPPRPFTEPNIAQVQIGVGSEVLEQLFGRPDSIYTLTFGKDVGEEWVGVAWRYYAVRDPKYVTTVEWKRNVFYFHRGPAGELRLNHWALEHTVIAK